MIDTEFNQMTYATVCAQAGMVPAVVEAEEDWKAVVDMHLGIIGTVL